MLATSMKPKTIAGIRMPRPRQMMSMGTPLWERSARGEVGFMRGVIGTSRTSNVQHPTLNVQRPPHPALSVRVQGRGKFRGHLVAHGSGVEVVVVAPVAVGEGGDFAGFDFAAAAPEDVGVTQRDSDGD